MNVVVDGLLLNYQDTGGKNDKVVLFIHGWADGSSTFKELSRLFSGKYRCIALDLPGFGGSQVPQQALDLPDFSKFIAGFTKKIQIKPYALVGHSNGGAVAINAVSSGSLKPEKLVLLASSGIRGRQKFKKSALKVLAKPAKAGLAMLPSAKRDYIKKKLYARIGSDYMVSGNMKNTFKNIVSYDVSADAARLALPVQLIYGSADTSTPPSMGRELHGLIKGSEFKLIDGAGHFVHHDELAAVAGLIEDFLK